MGSFAAAKDENSLAMGHTAQATAIGTLAIGNKATATNRDALAVGSNTKADGLDSVVVGNSASTAQGAGNGVAIGVRASVENISGIAVGGNSNSSKDFSMAIGASSEASGENAIALGHRANALADNSGLLGYNTTIGASGLNSYAIGNSNNITKQDVFALGNNITNTLDNSVFLGTNAGYTSTSDRTKGNSNLYTSDTVKGMNLTFAGGDQVKGVVSVGNDTETRRIQNVGPGLLSPNSTDAINGSQLYAVADKLYGGWTIAKESVPVGTVGSNNQVTFKGTGATTVDVTGTATDGYVVSINTPAVVSSASMKLEDGKNTTVSGNGSVETPFKVNANDTKVTGDANIKVTGGELGTDNIRNYQLALNNTIRTDTVNATNMTVTNAPTGDTDVTNKKYVDEGRTTVTSSDGSISVVDNPATSTLKDYDITVDYAKVADQTNLTYKSSDATGSDTAIKKVKLSTGLDFTSTENITASIDENGVVKATLNPELKGITSVANGNTIIKLGDSTINGGKTLNLGDSVITNMHSGSDGNGANGPTYTTDTNGANIGDVKNLAKSEAAKADTDIHVKKGSYKVTNNAVSMDLVDKNGNPTGSTVQITDVASAKDLSDVTDTVNKGTKHEGDVLAPNVTGKTNNFQQALGETTKIVGGVTDSTKLTDNNIGVVSNGKDTLTIKLNKDIKGIDTIGLNGKDGSDGVSISGKAGKLIVTESTTGTPVEHTVATTDDGLNFKGDSGNTVKKKLGETLDILGGATTSTTQKNIAVTEKDGELWVQLANAIKLDDNGSFTVGSTVINNGGVIITNTTPGGSSVTLTGGGLNNGGNKITNVAAGTADMDAVNYGQLKEVKDEAGKHASVTQGKNVTVSTATNGNGGTDYIVSVADKIALSDEGNVTIGDTTKLDKDGLKTGNTTVTTAGLTTGNTSVTTDGVTINQSAADPTKSVTLTNTGLNNGGNKITNVAAGTADTDAVNYGQLKEVKDEAGKHASVTAGKNVTISTATNANGGTDYKVSVNDQINLTKDGGVTIAGSQANPTKSVTLTNSGLNNGGNKITNVAEGTADTDAVNVKQLNDKMYKGWNVADGNGTTQNIASTKPVTFAGKDNTDTNGKNYGVTSTLTTKDGHATVTYDLTKDAKDAISKVDNIDNKGIYFAGNDGNDGNKTDAIKLGDTLNVKGDGQNITTTGSGKDLTISLGKDINLGPDSSLTTSTVNTHSITVTGQGNGNKITINGSTGTVDGLKNTTTHYQGFGQNGRAATEEQLAETANELVDGVNNSLNNLGNRVNKVGAHAAALSGLHPLDFDPDEKWTFAAGYGHYKNANAAAIGAFYRPNEDTMFSVGGSMGGGENMVNAGVSFKVGQGNHVSTGRVAMAKEIKDLRAELEHVKDALGRVSEGEKLTAMDMDKMKLFPDVPKNHWAYDYVAVLAGNGIIDGFPNGKFEGDRMMTRYEMAALLYRAMQNGAKADERMARALKEFAPELERIRVDTISKHKDGTPDIQRVRVIPGRG